jgi:hypothetical protein
VSSGVKCGLHGGKKIKTKSWTGAGAGQLTTGVCTRGLRRFTTKPLVTWLSHKTKTGGSTGGDGSRARREASMPADTWQNHWACVGRTRSAATAWLCDEEECYMTYMPFTGLYHNLSARGSVVFCLDRRDSYINSRVSRQTILPNCFSFPCSIGLDFSSVRNESNLRVNGSFHGCVDFLLVARVIFMTFSSYFRPRLVPSILRCLGSDLLVGIMDCCLVHLCA